MFPGFTSRRRAHGRAAPDRDGRARPVRGGDGAGRRHRAVAAGRRAAGGRTTAGSPRCHEVRVHRPGGRLGLLQDRGRPDRPDGARHAEQLRRRRDPVGHDAAPARRTSTSTSSAATARRGGAKPKLTRYGIGTTARYPSGSRKWDRADERFDLAKHPNEANRFGWIVELDPFDPERAPAQAHRARPVQARGRQRDRRRRRPRRRVHGRRRAVRLHLQVRLGQEVRAGQLLGGPRAQPDPARLRHALRREAHGDTRAAEIDGTGKLPADGAFDGTGQWIPLVRGNKSFVDGHDRRRGAHLHPARRRQGRRHQDGPPRGRRAEPVDRQGLRRADQQHRPRHRRQARRPTRPTRATPTSTGTSWSSSRTAATTPPRRSPGRCRSSAATRPTRRPTSPGTTRPRSARSPARTTSRSTRAGNLWISTDGNALGTNDGLFAMPVEGPERGHLKQFLTVPIGAETCGPFITAETSSRLRRRAAPRRDHRRVGREPGLDLAGRRLRQAGRGGLLAARRRPVGS